MAPSSFEIIQRGDAGDNTNRDGDKDDGVDAATIALRMRRDPEWATKAAESFDASLGAHVRDVTGLLSELKESQNKLHGKIIDARATATWATTIEGATITLGKLPEYVNKARSASRRMVELRDRLEKVEQRVAKLPASAK
jgi:hypothetical protein